MVRALRYMSGFHSIPSIAHGDDQIFWRRLPCHVPNYRERLSVEDDQRRQLSAGRLHHPAMTSSYTEDKGGISTMSDLHARSPIKEVVLITSGDLRQPANRVCWPAQEELERKLTNCFLSEGVTVR